MEEIQTRDVLGTLELTVDALAGEASTIEAISNASVFEDVLLHPKPYQRRWRVEDIHFAPTNGQMLKSDPTLLWLVVASSFVESASDLYTRNLLDYFAGDAELSNWLVADWEPEELQHGRALRTYVEHAWPEFDWERGFNGFLNDYSKLCRVEVLGPTMVLELVSRCVVETGTSTLYRAIRDATDDLYLRDITNQIQRDELQHFKHFFRYFCQYAKHSPPSRWTVLKTIAARTLEIRNSDSICALRHIIDGCTDVSGMSAIGKQKLLDPQAMFRATQRRLRDHYPVYAATKMLLAPLMLPPKTKVLASRTLGAVAKLLTI